MRQTAKDRPIGRSFAVYFCPFAFVTRRIEYKHLRCTKNKTYHELNLSFSSFSFAYSSIEIPNLSAF